MTPLLSAALAYVAGLLFGLRVDVPMLIIVTAGFFSFAVWRRIGPWLFCVLGVLVGGMRADQARTDCRATLRDGVRVIVTGAPLALSIDGTTTGFAVRTLITSTGARCGDTTVRVRAVSPHLALLDSSALGRVPLIEVHGRWRAYPQRSGWVRAPQFAGGVMIDRVVVSKATSREERAGLLTRFGALQQQRLRALLPERSPLAEALLLAQTRGMTTETRDRWVNAGLVHLLAISGMHVGLIAAGVLLLGKLLRLPQRKSRRLAMAVAAAYVLFLGAPAAALRSLLQAVLLLMALELQRSADRYTSLAASALVILVLEPLAILDAGFQLSFGGILGLMLWRRPCMNAMPRWLPHLVRDGLGSGIAASAVTTPIAALHFGTASWIGIIGTPLAVPLMAAALVLILVALIIAALTGAVTGLHAQAADVTLRLLDWLAAVCAAVPGGHGNMDAVTVLACLLALAAAIVIWRRLYVATPAPPSHAPEAAYGHYERRGRRRAFGVATAVAAALAIGAWAPRVIDSGGGRMEIHAIDVGQGDAIAIRTPAGRWVLVDAGPRSATRDAGRDRVVPYLLRHGVRRIDALLLSHPHADHIGGAHAVMAAFPIGVVVDPGLAFGQEMFTGLLDESIADGQRWVAGREGQTFRIDGVEITILYPFRQLDVSGDPNDFSLIVRLRFGRFGALLSGDAPEAVEDLVVARYGGDMQSEVLKIGHHGSRTSTGEALLEAADPAVALVSVGAGNMYRHPSPDVIARLVRHGVQVLRTDKHGDIIVSASHDGRFTVAARRP